MFPISAVAGAGAADGEALEERIERWSLSRAPGNRWACAIVRVMASLSLDGELVFMLLKAAEADE